MSQKTRDIHKLYLLFLVLTIAIVAIYRVYIIIVTGKIGSGDHDWIWKECHTAFLRLDPYKVFQDGTQVEDYYLTNHISTLPWGYLLAGILEGAFLPQTTSMSWYWIVRILAFLGVLFVVFRVMRDESRQVIGLITGFLLVIAPWYNISSIITANNGTLVCFLIIIGIYFLDRNEFVAGILWAFAMIKPQTALPFFAILLLRRRWKVIATSVTIVLTAWLLASVWIGVMPWELLQGVIQFSGAMEAEYHVVGIADQLRHIGLSTRAALGLSMVLGCAVLAIGERLIRKWMPDANGYLFTDWSIPAMVSVMWCYKTECDYMILIIVGLAILELWSEKCVKCNILLAICLVALYTKPFSSALLGRFSVLSDYMCNRLDLYFKTLMIIPFLMVLKELRVSVNDQNIEESIWTQ